MSCIRQYALSLFLAIVAAVDSSHASRHESHIKTLDGLVLLLQAMDATEARDHDRAIRLYSRAVRRQNLWANGSSDLTEALAHLG